MESHRAVPLSSPERCQPKVMVLVGGRLETQREKRLTDMLPMSVSRWAASVMMARLCARYPPVGTEQLVPHAPPAAPHPGPAPITYHLPNHEEAADSTGDAQLLVGLEPALPRAGGWGAAAAVESCSRGGRQCRGVSRACEETRGGGHCQQHRIWCSCPVVRSQAVGGAPAEPPPQQDEQPRDRQQQQEAVARGSRRNRSREWCGHPRGGAGGSEVLCLGPGCETGHRCGDVRRGQGAVGAEVLVRGAAVREGGRTAHRDGG